MGNGQIFSINAKTCTLKYNNQGGAFILDDKTKYVIPIFQRPYSWTEEELNKFITDIFSSFWGNGDTIIEEPIFIGTMQLSYKQKPNVQEIIDGQQRLTTFLILIKVLQHKYPDNKNLKDIKLDWLSTQVNSGEQQRYLEETIHGALLFNDETLNPYLKNASYINELIEKKISGDQEDLLDFDIDQFLNHLLSNVYFVVIETQAGLSKTLQIFKAINTTGLDLNGSDVFKIRMFEYLNDKKGKEESVFNEISQLYQSIDKYNEALKYQATDMTGILEIYQYILITKYNLPVVLYNYGTNTFYERLFDTIFDINQWEHFRNNVNNIELSLEEIQQVIDVRFNWENEWYQSAEDACSYKFIASSRYGKYSNILPCILLFYHNTANRYEFMRQLSKVYIIFSIRFLKAVNEVHAFTWSLLKQIANGSFESVMKTINQKIGTLENHKGYGDLEDILIGDITYNAKMKNIICRLSAMLDEDYKTTNSMLVEEIKNALFETAIDIEHIQSYHDKNGEKREDIWNEWQENINSIGNLMILEQDINRSISNKPHSYKTVRYAKSKFTIVKNHGATYEYWDLSKCLERKEKEKQKILSYIFN